MVGKMRVDYNPELAQRLDSVECIEHVGQLVFDYGKALCPSVRRHVCNAGVRSRKNGIISIFIRSPRKNPQPHVAVYVLSERSGVIYGSACVFVLKL